MKAVMKSLIPLLVVASAVAAVDVQKRVLNAVDCPKSDGRHYVVLRRRTSPYSSFCGGNLISQEWVLTAAHCDIGDFVMALGYHGVKQEDREDNVVPIEKHIYEKDSVLHDIMLVKLPPKLPPKPSRRLRVIRLPSDVNCKSFKFDEDYTIMGWSYTDVDQKNIKDQKKAVNLQCGEVKLDQSCIYPIIEAAPGIPSIYNIKPALCSYEPCEICQGDSGGSLVKDRVLYGVTVATYRTPKKWSWYMDVCRYIDWIRETTGIKE